MEQDSSKPRIQLSNGSLHDRGAELSDERMAGVTSLSEKIKPKCSSDTSQTPGRIQKVDPPILGSNTSIL